MLKHHDSSIPNSKQLIKCAFLAIQKDIHSYCLIRIFRQVSPSFSFALSLSLTHKIEHTLSTIHGDFICKNSFKNSFNSTALVSVCAVTKNRSSQNWNTHTSSIIIHSTSVLHFDSQTYQSCPQKDRIIQQ